MTPPPRCAGGRRLGGDPRDKNRLSMKLLRPTLEAIRGRASDAVANVRKSLGTALLAPALLGMGLLAADGALAQTRELSSSGVLLDRIAAVVNDGVVLASQLDAQTEEIIQRLRQQNTELPPRNVLRQQILERLVIEEIQMQRANKLGIQVSDEMVNGALDDVARRNGIGFADLPQALAEQGIDYRNFRDEIRRQMTLQLLRQRDVIARINVSPRELEQFMARQQNAPDRNAERTPAGPSAARTRTASRGKRSRKSRTTFTSGSMLNAAYVTTSTRPDCSSRTASTFRFARSTSARIRRAASSSLRPASVSSRRRPVRSNNVTPRRFSSVRMACDREGWEM